MFCPKCGSNNEEGKEACVNCGLVFSELNSDNESTPKPSITVLADQGKTVSKGSIISLVYFGLALVILIMFFVAAGSIVKGGSEIMQIESVGGTTLEEAYYAELGSIYSGYAMIARAFGVFCASILVWLGLKEK